MTFLISQMLSVLKMVYFLNLYFVVYKFPCGSCNSFYYEDTDNPLQVRPKFTVSVCVSYRL